MSAIFPALIPLWMMSIAVACGNTFLLKPAEKAPLTGTRLVELFTDAGLPPGVVGVVLPHEDADVAEALQQALEGEGLRFVLGATATRVEKEHGGVALSVVVEGTTETVRGSHLLVATGRRPNTDDLGLQEAGVQTDQQGFIRVNNRLETSVPGVWALGDVKGGPAFTHISFNDYQIVYANLVDGSPKRHSQG
jgi:pyruvate/2-oxoglutarate dehydrogenase complex dihydrolipoamide dehydrogenase (E3) component